MNKTVFVIRNDENSEYDRALAADYLTRLKNTLGKDDKNPSNPVVMTREVVTPNNKLDRTHIEIAEVPQDKVKDHESQGFAMA